MLTAGVMAAMKRILCLVVVLLGAGCTLLKGERRPPPTRATSSNLDAHQDEAVEAFISFHRQFGGVTQETEVSGVYFSQADWELVRGLTGSMRQAEVVFITRDNDGCAWSSWTLAQKSLGEDGWGMAQLLPGPLDTDAISCRTLEPQASGGGS